jgi:hypothetical protein
MTEVVGSLTSKHESLSSNPPYHQKKKKNQATNTSFYKTDWADFLDRKVLKKQKP